MSFRSKECTLRKLLHPRPRKANSPNLTPGPCLTKWQSHTNETKHMVLKSKPTSPLITVNHNTTEAEGTNLSPSLSGAYMMELVQGRACFIRTTKFSSPQKSRHYPNKSQTNTASSSSSSNFARTKSSVVRASDDLDTAVVLDKPRLRPPPRFQVFDGSPAPFGATPRDGGVNFAVFSTNALSATLCFTTPSDVQQVYLSIYLCSSSSSYMHLSLLCLVSYY